MFVAAPYRGSGIGTASKLLSALLVHAGENNIRRIYLGTTDKFLGAHRFYEKNGFTEVERSTLPESFPVMAVDSKFYAITLY
ncbi:GNAT superfamily N-acetyltransferase [Ochrobactrum sp. RH2CCR150]|nr:GNAT superfamily N-acetyltransferase [Ochrobactrum sp. RH2CCR150]